MARRRRKKNPLLTRILVISILAHVIALPVLAHFGAFDKLKKEFGTSRVVMVSLPPVNEDREKKPTEKKEKKAAKTQNAGKKSASAPAKSAEAAKSNLPQPKVVAATGGPDAGGEQGGPTVDPNGSGKAGVLPTGPGAGGGTGTPTPPAGGDTGETKPPVTPTPPAEPKPEPKPTPPSTPDPKPEPPKVEPKPKPFVQVEATYSPEPTIPDELRAEPFEKTLVVEADVDTDGKPSNVRVAESTGTKDLDTIGLDTARKWRFRPATLGDVPVQGHVRFRIIFKVE